MDMLKVNGPQRVQELLNAGDLTEAHAAARILKNSAQNLGLAALEDVCEQILELKDWKPQHPLALQAKSKLAGGQAALQQARQGI